jgi:hypothetical protein
MMYRQMVAKLSRELVYDLKFVGAGAGAGAGTDEKISTV